jgi:predicted alpha/beta superfamily hydrolase
MILMPVRRRTVMMGLPLMMMSTVSLFTTSRAQMQPADARLDILSATVSSHRLDDRIVRLQNGRAYRIFRALPKAPPPRGGYPILYLLDGNASFDLLTPDLLARCPGLVIVGIGYDTARKFAVDERSLDYTPPRSAGAGPYADPKRDGRLYGGADAFLASIVGELRHAAEEGVMVDADRRSLGGHSFGGLFALYALYQRPDAFAGYAPISPSVWWMPAALEDMEARVAWHAFKQIRLFIALGDREQRSNDKGPPPTGPAPETMALIARLSRQPVLEVRSKVLEGYGHGPSLLGALPMMLDWARE